MRLKLFFSVSLIFLLFINIICLPQTISSDLWVTDAQVATTAISGNTLYIGGWFTHVGPPTGGGTTIDATNGNLILSSAKVLGAVHAAVSDGSGHRP